MSSLPMRTYNKKDPQNTSLPVSESRTTLPPPPAPTYKGINKRYKKEEASQQPFSEEEFQERFKKEVITEPQTNDVPKDTKGVFINKKIEISLITAAGLLLLFFIVLGVRKFIENKDLREKELQEMGRAYQEYERNPPPPEVPSGEKAVIAFYGLCHDIAYEGHNAMIDTLLVSTDFKQALASGALDKQIPQHFTGLDADSLQNRYNTLVAETKKLLQTTDKKQQQHFLTAEKALFSQLNKLTSKAAYRLVTDAYDRDNFEVYKKNAFALKTLNDEICLQYTQKKNNRELLNKKYENYCKTELPLVRLQFSQSCFNTNFYQLTVLHGIDFTKVIRRAIDMNYRDKQRCFEEFQEMRQQTKWRTNPYQIISAARAREYYNY